MTGGAGQHSRAFAERHRTPLAQIKLPARIPFGFHGSRAEQDVLEKSIVTLALEHSTLT